MVVSLEVVVGEGGRKEESSGFVVKLSVEEGNKKRKMCLPSLILDLRFSIYIYLDEHIIKVTHV